MGNVLPSSVVALSRRSGLGLVTRGRGGRRLVNPLDIVDEGHVFLDVLATRFDVGGLVIPSRACLGKVSAYALLDRAYQQPHDRLDVAGLQRMVGRGGSRARDRGPRA